jgi:glycosyltransferase involved in cell wall biosynthesis
MNILMLCTKYSLDADSPYLCDELADELSKQGHCVTVLLMDWGNQHAGRQSNFVERNGLPTVVFAPTVHIDWLPSPFKRLARWLLSPLLAGKTAYELVSKNNFDRVVAFSPLTAMSAPIWFATRNKSLRRFLVQWDFFPDAQVQIGLMKPGFAARALRRIETYLIRRFDVIGCMSPKNIEYLRNNYDLAPSTQTVILPLWTSEPDFPKTPRETVRQRYQLPQDCSILVFGGQLIAGRGLEDIIAASRQLNPDNDRILFLIVGFGPLKGLITQEIELGNSFLRCIDSMPRKQYLELISACDAGIVATVRDVSVPTFPSKTLDYVLAGLLIISSTEEATDYGSIIEAMDLGFNVVAGDTNRFLQVVRPLSHAFARSPKSSTASRALAVEYFSVQNAAKIVMLIE